MFETMDHVHEESFIDTNFLIKRIDITRKGINTVPRSSSPSLFQKYERNVPLTII